MNHAHLGMALALLVSADFLASSGNEANSPEYPCLFHGTPAMVRASEHDPKKLQTFWIRSCDKTKI